jgi:hypothetical protein
MNLFKHLKVIGYFISTNIKRFNLVICFQAHHKLVEAFGGNLIRVNFKSFKFHFLFLEGAN